jgi:hypothetical protein
MVHVVGERRTSGYTTNTVKPMIAGAMNTYAALTSEPAPRDCDRDVDRDPPGRFTPTGSPGRALAGHYLSAQDGSSQLLDGNVSNGLVLGDGAVSSEGSQYCVRNVSKIAGA